MRHLSSFSPAATPIICRGPLPIGKAGLGDLVKRLRRRCPIYLGQPVYGSNLSREGAFGFDLHQTKGFSVPRMSPGLNGISQLLQSGIAAAYGQDDLLAPDQPGITLGGSGGRGPRRFRHLVGRLKE